MELVRAYVTLGFKEQKIEPKDVLRIVDRYLGGEDLQTIAKEEAIRIRNDFRREHIGPPTGDEDNSTRRTRPLPERPKPFGVRYEEQRSDDTMDEHKIRMSEERWKFGFLFSTMMVLAFNLTVAICGIKDIEIGFPIGFIPVPFLIGTLWMKNKRSGQLSKAKRMRENQEIESLLESSRQSIPPPPNARPSLGTTTVTR